MERLVDFLHLRLHQQLHVEGDLAARAGDQAEEATDFGDAVADGVPGRDRLAELEFLAQLFLAFQPILPSDDSVPAAPPNSATSTRARNCFSRSLWRSKPASKVAIL